MLAKLWRSHSLDTINEKLNNEKLNREKIAPGCQMDRQPSLDVVLVMDERETLDAYGSQSHAVQIKEIPVHQNQFDFTLYASYSAVEFSYMHSITVIYTASNAWRITHGVHRLVDDNCSTTDAPLPINRQQIYPTHSTAKATVRFVDAFENGYSMKRHRLTTTCRIGSNSARSRRSDTLATGIAGCGAQQQPHSTLSVYATSVV
ncbi:hypothetical protein P4S72_07710 [Vibrio sp. PP-XX7]